MGPMGPDDSVTEAGRGMPPGPVLHYLRAAALITVVAGAVGSVGLTIHAGRSTPRFLLVLFIIWVLSPFAALAWANLAAKDWLCLTQATLYCVTFVISLGSLAIYGGLIPPPAGSAPAFVFVAVPPGAWLLMVLAVPSTALILRRRSH
jgi:hypothetical protein